jgi:oligosaccharyltransferase complex subunit gamma
MSHALKLYFRRRAGQNSLIKLNRNDFTTYVRGNKNYHVAVMFTAIKPDRGCEICEEATEEFKVLSNSMRYTGSSSDFGKVFFVSVDYDEHGGSDIFTQMKLSSGYYKMKKYPKKCIVRWIMGSSRTY